MPFTLDPELAAIAGANGPALVWDLPRGDAIALRNNINTTMQMVDAAEPSSPDVNTANFTVPVEGGEILARWYTKERRVRGRRSCITTAAGWWADRSMRSIAWSRNMYRARGFRFSPSIIVWPRSIPARSLLRTATPLWRGL